MARYGVILRLAGALLLTIISKTPWTPRRATKIQNLSKNFFFLQGRTPLSYSVAGPTFMGIWLSSLILASMAVPQDGYEWAMSQITQLKVDYASAYSALERLLGKTSKIFIVHHTPENTM